jgi:hypothetical protein
VTLTIPSRKQICMTWLKIFIRSSNGRSHSIQGIDQGLYHLKRFKNRWLKYSSTQSSQRGMEITLLGMGIDTILWKEPSWIYDECHIMLLEHHGGGHPWFLPEEFKMKISVPMLNLTWLWATVSKCKSGTDLRETWPGTKYKSCRTLSDLSNGYLHTLIR